MITHILGSSTRTTALAQPRMRPIPSTKRLIVSAISGADTRASSTRRNHSEASSLFFRSCGCWPGECSCARSGPVGCPGQHTVVQRSIYEVNTRNARQCCQPWVRRRKTQAEEAGDTGSYGQRQPLRQEASRVLLLELSAVNELERRLCRLPTVEPAPTNRSSSRTCPPISKSHSPQTLKSGKPRKTTECWHTCMIRNLQKRASRAAR